MCLIIFFLLILHQSPRSILFPYTTLFRSRLRDGLPERARPAEAQGAAEAVARGARDGHRRRAQPAGAGEIGRDTSELQSLRHLVCRLLLEKKKKLTEKQNILQYTTIYLQL